MYSAIKEHTKGEYWMASTGFCFESCTKAWERARQNPTIITSTSLGRDSPSNSTSGGCFMSYLMRLWRNSKGKTVEANRVSRVK